MLTSLKLAVQRAQFGESRLGFFVNPFYFARSALARAIAELGPQVTGRVLDAGCGIQPYRDLTGAKDYVGLEYDSPRARAASRADFYYDGGRFPFDDASFDGVLTSQVLEHVFNPEEFVGEIARVLRPGGRLLLTVPFVWDEHEQPYDYGRYSSFGLKSLLEKHHLRVVHQRKTLADVRAICQLMNAYTFKKTYTGRPYLDLFATLVFMTPVNILGEIASRILPANSDFYLDNVVLAERMDSAPAQPDSGAAR